MANTISWLQSTDSNVSKYDLFSGPTQTGSWSFLISVANQTSSVYYVSGVFTYNDLAGAPGDWYRIDAVDILSQTGTSIFQVSASPSAVRGGNLVAWEPSVDPTVTPGGYYVIEAAPQVSGPWTVVANVGAALTGGNYNSITNRFIYGDENPFRPYSTWYRVIDVDQQGLMRRPSDPFLTHPMPYFVPGSTPFGVFDYDTQFQKDADKVADYIRKKLGEPVMQVHMSSTQIYAAFEEACLEYSAMVNSYQAKSVLGSFLGAPTGSLTGAENIYVNRTLTLAYNLSDAYATEANVNSAAPLYSGSIDLVPGQQTYDIPGMLSASGMWDGTGHIRIREVYHKSPMAAYRFFGTTSGLNYLNSQFRFESYTPETLFYLLPIWEDVLRGMQFKTSNNVRRSNYSFDIHNNCIRLYPVPQGSYKLWFTYTIDPNPMQTSGSGTLTNPNIHGVSNLSNIPFGNIMYSNVNSISKQWIWQMALAMAKEIEGQIRSKFSTVPIPNGDVTLNGPQLIQDAKAEMEYQRTQLRQLLDDLTYQKLMEREATMSQQLQDTWKGAALGIYVG